MDIFAALSPLVILSPLLRTLRYTLTKLWRRRKRAAANCLVRASLRRIVRRIPSRASTTLGDVSFPRWEHFSEAAASAQRGMVADSGAWRNGEHMGARTAPHVTLGNAMAASKAWRRLVAAAWRRQ